MILIFFFMRDENSPHGHDGRELPGAVRLRSGLGLTSALERCDSDSDSENDSENAVKVKSDCD